MTHRRDVCPPCALWFAIRTRSRSEQTVVNRLAAQDFETFLPRYLEPVQWSDRLKQTMRPLFPGYAFVRVASICEGAAVTRTKGVVEILGEPIPDEQIESIRIVCAARQTITPATYRTGELVRITSGPFEGCEGIVDRHRPNRLTLKIDLLRRAVSIEIDRKTSLERVISKAIKR